MIKNLVVLGSGSAGLIAALSFRRKLPQIQVSVVRDPSIGVIGVGEGTTPNFPRHLFDYLGIPRKTFYELAEPTWKLGIRFNWGAREHFNYTFAPQLDARLAQLPLPNGFYCDEVFDNLDLSSALMNQGKVFPAQANGCPDIQPWHAFHIENEKFVAVLEKIAVASGVEFIDGRVDDCRRNDNGLKAILLEDGRLIEGDYFIDCSGFRSELLGKALQEPFLDFKKTLFCDRAVVGGWERTEEPILPYTTSEQMSTGWCWQIEHERLINRGYVYCSDMISDEEAANEFRAKNPKVPDDPRIVKFRSGCYQRMWVDNVVAIGNAGGFVEPLEATALMIVCSHVQTLINFIQHSQLAPSPSMRDLYNRVTHETWLDIRDFLGLHYKPDTAMKTPFWDRCREETDLSGIEELLEFYRENGPTGFCRYSLQSTQNDFGLEGYLVMLLGHRVPHQKPYQPTDEECKIWRAHLEANKRKAQGGLTVEEALAYVRDPRWQWHDNPQG
ncbi:tryptophan 7-halogenase [Roseibacillus persicicus]|uniref:Tryptophan halogenase n=1 Tax=Roseibacillus persicicus TaxID=454148 RepID=A0A918WQJ0_9BACT|nr:tryptophan 7-halogenase [Roseibacillus persicicus]GHC66795.1 tryptophan halogenase [Roseibacillus persicicus]